MKEKNSKILKVLGILFIFSGTIIPISLNLTIYKYAEPGPMRESEKWVLKFFDDFDGDSLNESLWSANYPEGWPNGGHTHNHQAYMTEDNVLVEDGLLRIRADNSRHPDAPEPTYWGETYLGYNYTAGCITSWEKFQFKYGYIEARMKMPESIGFWPAFWTLDAEGSWPPEIDIHEYLSNEPNKIYGTYHWGPDWENLSSRGYNYKSDSDLSKDFHVYGLEWAPDHLAWYLDGKQYGKTFTDETAISQLGLQYVLINLGIGGWAEDPDPTTQWPAWYETDYVKIWQLIPDLAFSGQDLLIKS